MSIDPAFQQRSKARGSDWQKSDGITIPGLVWELTLVGNPDAKPTAESKSFAKSVVPFRTCDPRRRNLSYMEILTAVHREIFTANVESDYPALAERMSKVVDKFVNPAPVQQELLAKALLTLLARDDSIPGDTPLYVEPSGKTITKAELLTADEVCLDTLILGVWYFAITRDLPNSAGRDTFLRWHKEKTVKALPWVFDRQAFNADTSRNLALTRWAEHTPTLNSETGDEPRVEPEFDEKASRDVIDAEILDENGDSTDQAAAHEDSGSTQQQTVPQVVFQQVGSNNMQIGAIGTLNIGGWRQS